MNTKATYLSIFFLVFAGFSLSACGSSKITTKNVQQVSTRELLSAYSQVKAKISQIQTKMASIDSQSSDPPTSEIRHLISELRLVGGQYELVKDEINRRGSILFNDGMKFAGMKHLPCWKGGSDYWSRYMSSANCNRFGAAVGKHAGKFGQIETTLLKEGYWEKTNGGNVDPSSSAAKTLATRFKEICHNLYPDSPLT